MLCYRNFKYVYQTINSIFRQDYSNIELIISDDGSSNFPQDEIRSYVKKHCPPNITSWRINHNTTNVGTVKHLNIVAHMAQGEYFMSVSADDLIDHSEVVSTYVAHLHENDKADILMAQTAMYDEKMKKIQYYFVQPHIRQILLHDQESNTLFNEIAEHPYLPSVSTFFSKRFFEKYGYFDENYFLVEDWSLHLRIARKHIPICYVDFVSIRHRSGGVSHGNTLGTSETYKRYLNDLQQTYDREIKPYLSLLSPEVRERVQYQHLTDSAWIDWNIHMISKKISSIVPFCLKYGNILLEKCAGKLYSLIKGKQWRILAAGLFLNCLKQSIARILAYCFSIFGMISGGFEQNCLMVIAVLAYILIGVGAFTWLLYYLLLMYHTVTDNMQLYF